MSDRAVQLAWIDRVLHVAPPARGDAPPAQPGDSKADWGAALASWQDAVEEVDGQLNVLAKALRNSGNADLAEIGELGLSGMTNNTRVPLMAAIQGVGDGALAGLQAGAPKLRQAIAAFRAQIEGDPRIEACDDNPLEIPVAIAATYEEALEALETVLDRYGV